MNTPETVEPQDQAGPRTLQRGLLVLKTLQNHQGKGLSVTDLSRATQLQRPTIYRLLAARLDGTNHLHGGYQKNTLIGMADWRAGRFAPVPGESEFIPLPE